MSILKFPIQLDAGRAVFTSGEEEIKQRAAERLVQQKGRRFFQEKFGSDLHKLVGLRPSPALQSIARTYVREALAEMTSCKVREVKLTGELATVNLEVEIQTDTGTVEFGLVI